MIPRETRRKFHERPWRSRGCSHACTPHLMTTQTTPSPPTSNALQEDREVNETSDPLCRAPSCTFLSNWFRRGASRCLGSSSASVRPIPRVLQLLHVVRLTKVRQAPPTPAHLRHVGSTIQPGLESTPSLQPPSPTPEAHSCLWSAPPPPRKPNHPRYTLP